VKDSSIIIYDTKGKLSTELIIVNDFSETVKDSGQSDLSTNVQYSKKKQTLTLAISYTKCKWIHLFCTNSVHKVKYNTVAN
jgi:hypothetical protein